jgi:hypothetical protein
MTAADPPLSVLAEAIHVLRLRGPGWSVALCVYPDGQWTRIIISPSASPVYCGDQVAGGEVVMVIK